MHMVHLTFASGPFHARVLAARLGAAGIPVEVRGDSSPYPVNEPIEVLVASEDVDTARQILSADQAEADMADAVDSAFGEPSPRNHALWRAALSLLTVVLVVVVGFLAHVL